MSANDRSSPQHGSTTFNTADASPFVGVLRTNLRSDVITITEVKLENILLKHLHKRGIRKAWKTPLSLCLTCGLATLTATFSDKLGVKGDVWTALFGLGVVLSAAWLLAVLVRILWNWKTCSLEYLIETIKNVEAESQDQPNLPSATSRVVHRKSTLHTSHARRSR